MKHERTIPASSLLQRLADTTWFLPMLYSIAFATFAFIMLAVVNDDYLYATQEHSLFLNNTVFLSEHISSPAGLSAWIGCYLTQYFYYPWLGSVLLIVIWIAIYLMTIHTLCIRREYLIAGLIPVTALLISVIGLNYWIFCLNVEGYYFAESVNLLLCILSVYIHQLLNKKSVYLGIAWLLIWIIGGYMLMGMYAYLAVLLIIALNIRKIVTLITSIVGAVAVPVIATHIYESLDISMAYTAGLPLIAREDITAWTLLIPFGIMLLSLIVIAIQPKDSCKSNGIVWKKFWTIQATCTVVLVIMTVLLYQDNRTLSRQLRMHKAVEYCRWDEVLEEAKAHGDNRPTNAMVMYKLIALKNKGMLLDNLFDTRNDGMQPIGTDGLKVPISLQAGPLIYYHYGLINYAYRWAIENSVKYGLNAEELKIMLKCAIYNQEFDLATKYIKLLKTSTFQKNCTREYEDILRGNHLLSKTEEFACISPLFDKDNDIDNDGGKPIQYILGYFSNIRSSQIEKEELALAFALLSEAEWDYMLHFYDFCQNNPKADTPLVMQQAAYMFGLEEECPIDVSQFPFDNLNIVERYRHFANEYRTLASQGLQLTDIAERLRPAYGNTYWWYYYFFQDYTTDYSHTMQLIY